MFYYRKYSVHYKQNTAMVDTIRCHQNKPIDNSLNEKTEIIKSSSLSKFMKSALWTTEIEKNQKLYIIVMFIYNAIFMCYYGNISYIL